MTRSHRRRLASNKDISAGLAILGPLVSRNQPTVGFSSRASTAPVYNSYRIIAAINRYIFAVESNSRVE